MDGEVKSKLNANGRMNFPAKLRKGLGDTVVIAKAFFVPCLQIFSLDDWKIFEDKLSENNHSRKAEQVLRFMNKREEEIDKQGRFSVPQHFCDYAGLEADEEVIFNTVGKKIEIWNKGLWNKNMNDMDIEKLRDEIVF